MNTGEEKFAQTQPITEPRNAGSPDKNVGMSANDVDELGRQAGLEMSAEEELGLKAKLEERDDSRLDLDSTAQI